MSRREFLKRGVVGVVATLVLFVAGCGGGEEEENGEEDEEEDGGDYQSLILLFHRCCQPAAYHRFGTSLRNYRSHLVGVSIRYSGLSASRVETACRPACCWAFVEKHRSGRTISLSIV